MAIRLTLTDEQVEEMLVDCIETATTAVRALQNEGSYDPAYDDMEYCKRVVAQVLYERVVPPPDEFPASQGCIAYGFAVAAYIVLNREGRAEKSVARPSPTLSRSQVGLLINVNRLLNDFYEEWYLPLRFDSEEEECPEEKTEKKEVESENKRIVEEFDEFVQNLYYSGEREEP